MIKHLVFDLDGTLADTLPEIHASTVAFARQRGFRIPELEETRHGIGYGGRALLAGIFGFAPDSRELAEAYADFLVFYNQISGTTARLFPGVEEFLRGWMANEGRRGFSIITNKPGRPAEQVIRFTGLTQFAWSAVIHGESLARKKPDPLPFTECFRIADVMPAEVLVIGDSDADILGARNCGARSLAVSFGYTALPELEALRPDGFLHDYRDLNEVIARLERRAIDEDEIP